MQEPEKGGACISVAGRDKGRLYLIVRQDGTNLYLADGKYRTSENPKQWFPHLTLAPLGQGIQTLDFHSCGYTAPQCPWLSGILSVKITATCNN